MVTLFHSSKLYSRSNLMNENQKFEFVTAMISELSNTGYSEMLSTGDRVIRLSNNRNITVEIRNVNEMAVVKAENDILNTTVSLPKNNMVSLMERFGLLDKKLESKLDFIFNHKEIMKKPEAIKLTIEFMIDSQFPELKGNIRVQIGGDRDEVILFLKNGLDDPMFKNAFPSLILRKSFFENCKLFGVRKLVFIDETNKTFDDIEIDSFDVRKLM